MTSNLGSCLDRVAKRLRAHCLVEVDGGVVIAHAVFRAVVPEAFTTSVLTRSTVPLAAGLRAARTQGLLPGGPVTMAQLEGWEGAVRTAPVLRSGHRLGWLWLLVSDAECTVEDVAHAADDVAASCAERDRFREDLVRAALDGVAALPFSLSRGAQTVAVAALRSEPALPGEELCAAIATRSEGWLGLAAAGDLAYVVLADPSFAEVVRARAEQHLGVSVAGGVSAEHSSGSALAVARQQAEAVLGARTTWGACVDLATARSEIVLGLLESTLNRLPDLGRDPVGSLLARDASRSSDLAGALLAWLDAGGDTAGAAAALVVHPNTLRYRLKLAWAELAADLGDPAVRLEVHLRLRGTLKGRAL